MLSDDLDTVDDVLEEIQFARNHARVAQILVYRVKAALWPWTRRRLMSALSDRIDAVNASLVALDNQAPGAISAAIAAAAANAPPDTAAADSLTTLEGTVSKLTTDLQAVVPAA